MADEGKTATMDLFKADENGNIEEINVEQLEDGTMAVKDEAIEEVVAGMIKEVEGEVSIDEEDDLGSEIKF